MSPSSSRFSFSNPTVARLWAVVVVLVVALLGLGVGIGLVFGLSVVALLAGVRPTPAVALVISLVSIQGVAFGGLALVYLKLRGRSVVSLGVHLPDLRESLFVLGGYVTAFLAAAVGAVAVTLTNAPTGENQVAELANADPSVLLWLIPASVLLIGPGEELLFRGIVQGRLRETFSPVWGVVLASALFASVHFVALTGGVGGRLVTILVLFLPSLVFGSVYELTDNLVVPALVHGLYNATLFALAYAAFKLSRSGATSPGGGAGTGTATAATLAGASAAWHHALSVAAALPF
ncbi:MAG: lysostaphin resistance A-like protein [Haloplanus sp.]